MPIRGQQAREAGWRADLEVLGTQLEARHPDLYHSISREAFRAGLADIRDRVASLSDDGIALALARLLARVGDGHTLVPLRWDDSLAYRRLPLEFIRTREGLSVLGADSSLTNVAGSGVVRIGRLPAEQALYSLTTLISPDNAWTARSEVAGYAEVPEILHGLGITSSREQARLVVESRDGTRREIVVNAVNRDAERLLCEAFRIDPQFDLALERMITCAGRNP